MSLQIRVVAALATVAAAAFAATSIPASVGSTPAARPTAATGGGLVRLGCVGNAAGPGHTGGPGPASCIGADGLAGAVGVAVSPDGKNVYVASAKGHAVAVLRRVAGGRLQRLSCLGNSGNAGNPGNPGPTSCAETDGLDSPFGIAVSPDGKNVYVASVNSNAVVPFRRAAGGGLKSMACVGNATSPSNVGRPGPTSCTGADGLGGAAAVAVSPDGKNVYVASASGNAVALFGRVAGGALQRIGCLGNANSPGNTGKPGPASCVGADGLGGADGIAISPDGKNVYVASGAGNAVAIFKRVAGGALQRIGCLGNANSPGNTGKPGPASCTGADGLGGAFGIAVSPDGRNVYVASNAGNAVAVFGRAADGGLVRMGCVGNAAGGGNTGSSGPTSCTGADGLGGAAAVSVSPDGKNVYVASASSNAVALFGRAADGELVRSGCVGNAGGSGNTGDPGPASCTGADGLGGADGIAVSPDGKNVYATSLDGNALALFARGAVPPGITNVTVKPARFTVAKGTTFGYMLSERAAVTFTIERKRAGGYSPVGAFTQQGAAGKNQNHFSGKVGKATLSPGSYRATLVAADAAGLKSQPNQVTFAVTRG